jgi:hypothetical protein
MSRTSVIWNYRLSEYNSAFGADAFGVIVFLYADTAEDGFGPFVTKFQQEYGSPGIVPAATVEMRLMSGSFYQCEYEFPAAMIASGKGYIEFNVLRSINDGEWSGQPGFTGSANVNFGTKTQADIDAAVAAAILPFNKSLITIQTVNYQLGQEVQGLKAVRDTLQLRVTELETTPPTVGFVPALRTGQYTIKDFSVLDGIQRTIIGTYSKFDIDFVNVQLLSMKQGALKMRRIAAVANSEFGFKFRTKIAKDMEYTAKKANGFNEYLLESARIIEFAVDEVRNNQRFDLDNTQFLRTIL